MTATAKARWEALHSRRGAVIDRARQCADLTIPSVLPREGHSEDALLPTPYQSIGSRGVNNLASRLLLTLLPPNVSFFRLDIEDAVKATLGENTEVEEALRGLETKAMKRVEKSRMRGTLHSVLKHMVITGNSLMYLPMKDAPQAFTLDKYVIVRDKAGTVIEIVTKESVDPLTLSDAVREACKVSEDGDNKDGKNTDVFMHVRLKDNRHEWYTEINEIRVPDSDGRTPADASPWLPLRWSAVPGEHYGRGLVEEYLGDLRSHEGLSKAIVGFAAAAAKILVGIRPNATTREEDVTDSESGDVIIGNPEDLWSFQLEKYADFQVAKGVLDDLTLRLSQAFLLRSGTVRDAERVTAEEIRAMAQELEDVLGGTYSILAQDFQYPLVKRLIAQMMADGDFPKLPKVAGKEALNPTIITGFDALGRNHELNRLRAYFGDLAQINPNILGQFDDRKVAMSFGTGHNINVKDLLKTEEQLAQEQEAAQMGGMMEKAAGPMAGAIAKGMNSDG